MVMEADVEFLWLGVGGGGGVQSHFCVQPNYSVEVVLCCCWGCDKNSLQVSRSPCTIIDLCTKNALFIIIRKII